MQPAMLAARPRLLNRQRLGRLGSFASTQMAVQALGLLSALVLVRNLPTQEFSWLTLCQAAVSVGGVLLDLGLCMGAMALGGRHGGRPSALGAVLEDARRVQARMVLWLLPPLTLLLAVMLQRQQAPWALAALLAVLTAGTVALNLRTSLGLVAVRLLAQLRVQQSLELGCQLVRLLVLAALAAWAVQALTAAWACVLSLVLAAVMAGTLQRFTALHAPGPAQQAPDTHRTALWQSVRAQAPNSLYFVLSSQVGLGLIAVFGNAREVAEVGALGRLGALFTLIGAVTAAVVLPFFARHQDQHQLARGLLAVHASFGSLLALLVGLAAAVPGLLLWVLGPNYTGLHAELGWLLAASTLGAWAGTLYSIGCARGWVLPFVRSAGVGVLSMALTALTVDVSTVRGVLMVNTAAGAAALLLAAWFLWRHLDELATLPEDRSAKT